MPVDEMSSLHGFDLLAPVLPAQLAVLANAAPIARSPHPLSYFWHEAVVENADMHDDQKNKISY